MMKLLARTILWLELRSKELPHHINNKSHLTELCDDLWLRRCFIARNLSLSTHEHQCQLVNEKNALEAVQRVWSLITFSIFKPRFLFVFYLEMRKWGKRFHFLREFLILAGKFILGKCKLLLSWQTRFVQPDALFSFAAGVGSINFYGLVNREYCRLRVF